MLKFRESVCHCCDLIATMARTLAELKVCALIKHSVWCCGCQGSPAPSRVDYLVRPAEAPMFACGNDVWLLALADAQRISARA